MKKVLIILAITLFALTSCSSSGSKDSTREKLKESQKKILGSFTDSMSDKEKKKFDDYIICYIDNIYKKLDDKTIEKLADVDSVSKSQAFDKKISEKEKMQFLKQHLNVHLNFIQKSSKNEKIYINNDYIASKPYSLFQQRLQKCL